MISAFVGEAVINHNRNENAHQAKAVVIWMHGLGADGSDMEGLAAQLPLQAGLLKHVFLDAPVRKVTINSGMPMPAWYDITGATLNDREDKAGILQSREQILQALDQEMDSGFHSHQIYLAGFSQGGAMALFTALNFDKPLAGVIALSAYIPLASECQLTLPKATPIFMGLGYMDPLVLPKWTQQSANWLNSQGYESICLKEYMMAHAVCAQEIFDVSDWISQQIEGK